MITKILHLADIHIPNDEKHRPYGDMLLSFLDKLYTNELQGYDPSEIRIVIVGDIFHNKIKATNEAKTIFHQMVNKLNGFCKTYIVAGNHDMLENNHDRVDSIAPTFEIDGVYPNVVYADKVLGYKSGCIVDDNVVFAVYSMHDDFARPEFLRSNYEGKRIIGLYHGDVVGAVTDVGHVSTEGIDTGTFSDCDCVMAGHIHKFQDLEKNGVHIVYAGSLFQQNAGENTTGHGYLSWDVETLKYNHVEAENNYRIFKFKVNDYDAFAEDRETVVNL